MSMTDRPRLFLFNPDCEMAIADGGLFYTPPAHVVQMAEDLAFLPAWLGDEGDRVLVGTLPDEHFMETVRRVFQLKCLPLRECELGDFPNLKGEPWGCSPKMGHWLAEHGLGEEWKTERKEWYSRKTARAGLGRLLETLPETEPEVLPRICSSIAEIEQGIRGGAYRVKAPWSSSGKGQLALSGQVGSKEREWLTGVLRRQGYLMLERQLDKVKDFAAEFYMGEKGAEFVGWSFFVTGNHGEYRGNYVGIAGEPEEGLGGCVSASYADLLLREVTEMLNGLLPHYRGYLGVDMMIYRDASGRYRVQPCVEINLRYNMGIVALFLSRRYIALDGRGVFEVRYFPKPGQALEEHIRLQREQPAVYENNRLKSGYFPLTPVNEATHFVASVRCY